MLGLQGAQCTDGSGQTVQLSFCSENSSAQCSPPGCGANAICDSLGGAGAGKECFAGDAGNCPDSVSREKDSRYSGIIIDEPDCTWIDGYFPFDEVVDSPNENMPWDEESYWAFYAGYPQSLYPEVNDGLNYDPTNPPTRKCRSGSTDGGACQSDDPGRDECYSAGNPVRLTNGRKWEKPVDFTFRLPNGDEVEFWRKYSSTEDIAALVPLGDPGIGGISQAAGYFGPGWSHTFRYFIPDPGESFITMNVKNPLNSPSCTPTPPPNNGDPTSAIRVVTPDGEIVSFLIEPNRVMAKDPSEPDFVYMDWKTGVNQYTAAAGGSFSPGLPLLQQHYRYHFRTLYQVAPSLPDGSPAGPNWVRMGHMFSDEETGFSYYFDIYGTLRKILKDGADWCLVYRESDVSPGGSPDIHYLFLPTSTNPAGLGPWSGFDVQMHVASAAPWATVLYVTGPTYTTITPGSRGKKTAPPFHRADYIYDANDSLTTVTYYNLAGTADGLSYSYGYDGNPPDRTRIKMGSKAKSKSKSRSPYPPSLTNIQQWQNNAEIYSNTYVYQSPYGFPVVTTESRDGNTLFDFAYTWTTLAGSPFISETDVTEHLTSTVTQTAVNQFTAYNYNQGALSDTLPSLMSNFCSGCGGSQGNSYSWRDSSRPKHVQDAMGQSDWCYVYGTGQNAWEDDVQPALDARFVYMRQAIWCPGTPTLNSPCPAVPAANCRQYLLSYDSVDPYDDTQVPAHKYHGYGTGKLLHVAGPGVFQGQQKTTNYQYYESDQPMQPRLAVADVNGWTWVSAGGGLYQWNPADYVEHFGWNGLIPTCYQNPEQNSSLAPNATENACVGDATQFGYDSDEGWLASTQFANGEAFYYANYNDAVGRPRTATDSNGVKVIVPARVNDFETPTPKRLV
jgi:hypothetical protein